MKKFKTIGLCAFVLIVCVLLALREVGPQTVRAKARTLREVQSKEALIELLGQPDAITSASPVPDIPEVSRNLHGRSFVYDGPTSLGSMFGKAFPYFNPARRQPRWWLVIHFMRNESRDSVDQVNDLLTWGPRRFGKAVIVERQKTNEN